jgi:hypothetical protein
LLAMREPSARGGRGLRLVQELSLDWGTESTRDEKIVWFEVPTSASDNEPTPKMNRFSIPTHAPASEEARRGEVG